MLYWKKKNCRQLCWLAVAMMMGMALPSAEAKTVKPVESNIAGERFQQFILYRALEELGYEIKKAVIPQLPPSAAHGQVGKNKGDFMAFHWEKLHDKFFQEAGGKNKLTRAGVLATGALQGYLVDRESYKAGVRNLNDLKKPANVARFDTDGDGKADLIGCPPGWGCQLIIDHHVQAYGLADEVKHNQGNYDALMDETIKRHKQNNPVLYYTWTPYWTSGVLVPGRDVEWIEVPFTSLPGGKNNVDTKFAGKNLGFAIDNIVIIANNDFLRENPQARKLFEIAKISTNDISAQNSRMRNGEDKTADIERHTDEWIAKNRNLFRQWIIDARKAG